MTRLCEQKPLGNRGSRIFFDAGQSSSLLQASSGVDYYLLIMGLMNNQVIKGPNYHG